MLSRVRASMSVTLWLGMGIGITVVLLVQGCSGDKYKTVVNAAESGLGSLTIADDYRHQRRLQEALLAEPAFAELVLTSYVFLDHGYVIGHVQSSEQAEAVYRVASNVEGLRSLNAFLPVKRSSSFDAIGKVTPDEKLKGQIRAALARTRGLVDSRVHVEVLDDRAVLLGVVSDNEEKTRAEQAAAGTIGVKRIINWLLLAESEYLAIRSQVF
jgi:osmotically-inducible protein OsmY